MNFGVGRYRCEVSQTGGVFLGKVFEQDDLLVTFSAEGLGALRRRFHEWVAEEGGQPTFSARANVPLSEHRSGPSSRTTPLHPARPTRRAGRGRWLRRG